MPKHVVLDSIARSGTTLLSALIRSQENSTSFCPGFSEYLCCNETPEWPHGACRSNFVNDQDIDFKKFQTDSISQINDYSQYYGVSEDSWIEIINNSQTTEEFYKKLEKKIFNSNVFCYRWNQGLYYFYEWIKKGDDYLWLSMIRNPLDRACSSFEKHRWSFVDSLKNTVSFAEKLQEVKGNNKFFLIHYEDLIKEPEKIINDIYSFFGVKLSNINLENIKGSNGEEFIPQTSTMKNVYNKVDGYIQGNKFNGLYDKQINRYKTEYLVDSFGHKYNICDKTTYDNFEKALSGFDEYSRYFSKEDRDCLPSKNGLTSK